MREVLLVGGPREMAEIAPQRLVCRVREMVKQMVSKLAPAQLS